MLNNLDDILYQLSVEPDLSSVLREIESMHTFKCNDYEKIDKIIPNLDDIRLSYAQLLYESEISVAKKIRTWTDIKSFYKWSVYELRCSFELTCYHHLAVRPLENILFVGAGAIPISAIIASTSGLNVTVIERDDAAIELSENLCSRLNVPIDHVHMDLVNYLGYDLYDLIVISGTVGITSKDKQTIAEHVLSNCDKTCQLCFRNPVREEGVIMAPFRPNGNFKFSEYYFENAEDYISRVYVQPY